MQQDGVLGVTGTGTHGDGSTLLPYVEKPPSHTGTPDAPA